MHWIQSLFSSLKQRWGWWGLRGLICSEFGAFLIVVGWFVFVDWFAALEVVELMWDSGVGGASWMPRPLASVSEREAEPTDVHGVDNRKRTLGARQLRADDAQWLKGTERHKSRNRWPSLLRHRSCCSNHPPSTAALRESKPSMCSVSSKSSY